MRTHSTKTGPPRDHVGLSVLLTGGPVVLDGAMGTELGARGVRTAQELWSAVALTEAPEAVTAVHTDYLFAGARVICTNSYQATVPALMRTGLTEAEARGAIATSARLALDARDLHVSAHPRETVLVAGSLGPYGAYLADGAEYTGAYTTSDSDFEAVHIPRLQVLAEAGLHLFAIETQPRLDEARWLVARLRHIAPEAECWVSFQVRPDGEHLADGTPLARAVAWADAEDAVVAVGLNCVAPAVVDRALPVLRSATGKPLVAYPNSGDAYDPAAKTWHCVRGPERFTRFTASAPAWLDAGVRLIGGCCRTTPVDTAVLHDLVVGD